jgi:hypothetical protein
MKGLFGAVVPWALGPTLGLALLGGGYVLSRSWSDDSHLDEIRRSASDVRMRGVEKRLGELDVRLDALSSALRLERQSREDSEQERQLRVDAIVARANTLRDARDR